MSNLKRLLEGLNYNNLDSLAGKSEVAVTKKKYHNSNYNHNFNYNYIWPELEMSHTRKNTLETSF